MPSVRTSFCSRPAGLAVCTVTIAGLLLQAGCATIKTPTWPWSKSPAADNKLAGELGEDADSAVISSEFNPTEQDFDEDVLTSSPESSDAEDTHPLSDDEADAGHTATDPT